MSWKTEITPIVRVFIDDMDCDDYTDARLHTVIVTAAKVVDVEAKLTNSYVISIENATITPDPTASTPDDDEFITLVALKASCLLLEADMKSKALFDGVTAKCGPVALGSSGSNAWQWFKDQGACAMYNKLRKEIEFYRPLCEGRFFKSILSPFVNSNFKCSTGGS